MTQVTDSTQRVDLLPCPFCGKQPTVSKRMDEDLWSHNVVEWVGVRCRDCDIGFDWPPDAEISAADQWNRRALPRAEAWRPISEAPRDGTSVLLKFKDSLAEYGERIEHWAGINFVGRHPGIRASGFDMGWQFAAPVGQGGFDDAWLSGWMPLPTPPALSAPASGGT